MDRVQYGQPKRKPPPDGGRSYFWVVAVCPYHAWYRGHRLLGFGCSNGQTLRIMFSWWEQSTPDWHRVHVTVKYAQEAEIWVLFGSFWFRPTCDMEKSRWSKWHFGPVETQGKKIYQWPLYHRQGLLRRESPHQTAPHISASWTPKSLLATTLSVKASLDNNPQYVYPLWALRCYREGKSGKDQMGPRVAHRGGSWVGDPHHAMQHYPYRRSSG